MNLVKEVVIVSESLSSDMIFCKRKEGSENEKRAKRDGGTKKKQDLLKFKSKKMSKKKR
jgi:hypothetical protein